MVVIALEPDLAPRALLFFPAFALPERVLLREVLADLARVAFPPVLRAVVCFPLFARADLLSPVVFERVDILRAADLPRFIVLPWLVVLRAVLFERLAVLLVLLRAIPAFPLDFLAVVFFDRVAVPPRPLIRAEVFFGVDLVLAADVRFFILDGIILL